MLADAGALVLAICSPNDFAGQALRTDRTTFGFRRAEVLAAFVNGIALAFVGLLIVKEAMETLDHAGRHSRAPHAAHRDGRLGGPNLVWSR